MTYQEDFTGVTAQDGDFSKLPEGTYRVVVDKTKETHSAKGNYMVKVKYMVTDGQCKNLVAWDNIVFHENMKGRNKHLLKVLGQPHVEEVDVDPEQWIGRELIIRIRHELWKGKLHGRITQYLYSDDEAAEKEIENQKSNKTDKKKETKETETETESNETEDIPF